MARKRTRSSSSIRAGKIKTGIIRTKIIRTIGKPPSMLVPDAVVKRALKSLNKPKRRV